MKLDKQSFIAALEMIGMICTVIVAVITEEDQRKEEVSDARASRGRPVRK